MIVMLSRARLGMYILGNISYFKEGKKPNDSIKHFKEVISRSEQPAEQVFYILDSF